MSGSGSGAVYVQTNAAPNEVIAFRRAGDGSLERLGVTGTGGDGDGMPHLTSQGSMVVTGDRRHLLVTNAASDDLSVFAIAGDGGLELRDRVHVGAAPKSVAERDGLVVVLATGKPGLVSFRLEAAALTPVIGADLLLADGDADPAQVGFSPDGSTIVVTERGTDSIVTYEVMADGSPGSPRSIASQGPTPYGFAFSSRGALVVTEAFRAERGAAAASSYALVEGALVPRTASVGNGRSEICWAVVTPDDRFAFTTNFADGAVSRYAIGADGSLSLDDAVAATAVEGASGLRDEGLTPDGRFLYAIDADGARLYAWAVGSDGSLDPIGSWHGVPATVAGLAAI